MNSAGIRHLHADIAVETPAELGEGASWDADRHELIWVELTAGIIHRWNPDTGQDNAVYSPVPVGSVAPRASGGLIAARAHAFSTWDETAGWIDLPSPEMIGDLKFNDGKCDPSGAFWAGTMTQNSTSTATLYRLDPDHTHSPVLDGLTVSNGLAWTPDGEILYHVDTPTRRIDAYTLTDGAAHSRRALTAITAGDPDGMWIDETGALWVALWDGGVVHRYTPDGDLDTVVHVPAIRPTSCAFVGERLYITTARGWLSEDALSTYPLSGSLFVCTPGVTGPAAVAWRG
ncbi:SMP-30/gluconolactonase/LRE family protein [Nocardia sp. NPDC004722]